MVRQLSEADDAARTKIYNESKSDGEAAKKLGLTLAAFRSWRMNRQLPPKKDQRLLPTEEVQRRIEVLKRSKSLAAAARELGLTPVALRNFRASHMVEEVEETEFVTTLPAKERKTNEDKALYAAYRKAGSDAEAAKIVGIPSTEFCTWRAKKGLTAKSFIHRAKEADKRRSMYENGANDEQVAKAFGISEQTAKSWRSVHMPDLRFHLALPSEEEKRRTEGYKVTANDKEAALLLDININTFRQWRGSHSLPSKKSRVMHMDVHRRADAYVHADSDDAAALHASESVWEFVQTHFANLAEAKRALNWTDEHYSKIRGASSSYLRQTEEFPREQARRRLMFTVGISPGTFTEWRLMHNLPPYSKLDEEINRRIQAWLDSPTDADACAELELSPSAFRSWRAKHKLPVKTPLWHDFAVRSGVITQPNAS